MFGEELTVTGTTIILICGDEVVCVAILAQILKVIFQDILASSLVYESDFFFIPYVFNYVYPILHKKKEKWTYFCRSLTIILFV
jgi:hypothetical protein